MNVARKRQRRPHVGDTVTFPYGAFVATGRVIEDRGNVGAGGRHILRVSVDVGAEADPMQFEIPADTIESIHLRAARRQCRCCAAR